MKNLLRKLTTLVGSATLLGISQTPAHAIDNELTLYFWGASISGEANLRRGTVPFGADFDELLEDLEAGFQMHYEGRGRTWGGGLDITYMSLENEKTIFDTQVDSAIVEGFASYRVSDRFDLLGGVRFNGIETEVLVAGETAATSDVDVVDGFIGARVFAPVSANWTFHARLDVGAGDSDFVWNTVIGLGWAFSRSGMLRLAYRILDYDVTSESGPLNTNIEIQYDGPAIGIGFTF